MEKPVSQNPVKRPYQRLGVLGAGAWGTALAQAAALAGRDVIVWARDKNLAARIQKSRKNTHYLPHLVLHERIDVTEDMARLAEAEAVLSVVPAQNTREVLNLFSPHVVETLPILLCSKGLEQGSLDFMHQVLEEVIPQACPAVLSGPSFAHDVAQGHPTAITLACIDREIGQTLSYTLGRPAFRPYWTDDLIGAETGGAVKNVLAIACGMSDGLGLGESARAALITRGFAEMRRLGLALGARRETLTGLCGLGDLLLTCSSQKSRNFSYGYKLGQSAGSRPEGYSMLTEGVTTAPALAALAQKLNIDMPLVQTVAALLAQKTTLGEAMKDLLNRPFRSESL